MIICQDNFSLLQQIDEFNVLLNIDVHCGFTLPSNYECQNMSKSKKRILDVNLLNIWEHQKDAIREIVGYIEEYSNNAFLVKMPTGTGKTGVFATLSRVAHPELNYIIITPSTALKFQIVE